MSTAREEAAAAAPGPAVPRAAFAFAFALAPEGWREVRRGDRSVTQHPHSLPWKKTRRHRDPRAAARSPQLRRPRGTGTRTVPCGGPGTSPAFPFSLLVTPAVPSAPGPRAEGVGEAVETQTPSHQNGWWASHPARLHSVTSPHLSSPVALTSTVPDQELADKWPCAPPVRAGDCG